jgi:hypothetical protein
LGRAERCGDEWMVIILINPYPPDEITKMVMRGSRGI